MTYENRTPDASGQPQPQPYWPPQPQGEQPPPALKKKHTARNVVLATVGAVVLAVCGIGGIGALIGGNDTTTGAVTSDTTRDPTPAATTEATTAAPTVTAAKPTTPAVAKPAAPKVIAISDEDTPGLVGRDFPAGVYRVTTNVAGMDCYWMKASDSEGNNIIDNDLPQGGRPQVTLKKGQWFTSERCGTWHRQ
jgi:hypothetical protein